MHINKEDGKLINFIKEKSINDIKRPYDYQPFKNMLSIVESYIIENYAEQDTVMWEISAC